MTRTLKLDRGCEPASGKSLVRLVYLSECAIPHGKGHFRAEIADILCKCERNNTPAGITGILVHDRGRFIQLLEGPEAALDRLFAQIRSDKRHTSVTVLLREPCLDRLVPDWSMAFLNAGDATLRDDQESGWQNIAHATLITRLLEARDELSVMRLPLAARREACR